MEYGNNGQSCIIIFTVFALAPGLDNHSEECRVGGFLLDIRYGLLNSGFLLI